MGRSGWKFCSAVALGLMVFFSGPSVMAQDGETTSTGRMGRGGRGSAGPFRAALEVQGLTDEQKAKIEKIQTDARDKFQALRTKAGNEGGAAGQGGRGAFGGTEMRKIVEETQAQVEAVLTEEQKKEYKEKLGAQRARWTSRGTSATATSGGDKQ